MAGTLHSACTLHRGSMMSSTASSRADSPGKWTVYGLPSGRLFKVILVVVGSLCWLIVPLWQAARTFVRKDF